MPKLSFSSQSFAWRNATPFVAAAAIVGVVVVVLVHAAGPLAAFEAESGTLSGATTVAGVTGQSGSGVVQFGIGTTPTPSPTPTPTGGGTCTNSLSCWPGASNTGYQNAPGYPGTPGVEDASKLTNGSSSSSACPTTFQSNHTYSFCHYTGGIDIGSTGGHLTNVHMIGWLVEDLDTTDGSSAIKLYCDSNCTMDYFTVKPTGLAAPNVPAPKHGTTYAKSYPAVLGAGWGNYNTVGHGFSFTHANVWGARSEILVGDNSATTPNLIQDNWMHDQGQCLEDSSCPTHSDGIGMTNTGNSASYLTINHNNMPFIEDNTNDIAFQEGTYSHLTITDNIFAGDGYTVAIWHTSNNIIFTGNVWTNYAQPYFGVNYGEPFWTVSSNTWAHNKFMWDPTGANPFYEGGPGQGNVGPITQADSGKCWVPSGLSTTDYGGGSC